MKRYMVMAEEVGLVLGVRSGKDQSEICYTLLNFSITSSKLLHWSFTSAIFAMSCTSKLFIRCRRLRRVLRSVPSQPIEEYKRLSVHRPFLPSEYLDLMNLYLSFSCRIICITFSYLFVFISQPLSRDLNIIFSGLISHYGDIFRW
jgi:hypothetical protein